MSIHIQLANELKKISGEKITSSKITAALGYKPSNFSGDYGDLDNAPMITNEASDTALYVQDSQGNIIAKIDETGLIIPGVNTSSITLNGQDLQEQLDLINGEMSTDIGSINNSLTQINNSIDGIEDRIDNLTFDDIHGDNISTNTSEFFIQDSQGNIIAKIDENGITTTTVTAKEAIIANINVENEFKTINSNISTINDNIDLLDKDIEDTKDKLENITFNDINGDPNLTDSNDNFIIQDQNSNIILQVNQDGLTTTKVITKELTVNGQDLSGSLSELEDSLNQKINDAKDELSEDIKETNDRIDNITFDDINGDPNLKDSGDSLDIQDNSGNIVAKIDKDGITTTSVQASVLYANGKNVEESLNTLDDNLDKEITRATKAEEALQEVVNEVDERLDNITFDDINGDPNLKDSGDSFEIQDDKGNIIVRVDENGITTTNIRTTEIELNNEKLTETIKNIELDIQQETLRAKAAEQGLQGSIDNLTNTKASKVELNAEVTNLNKSIAAEKARAEKAEQDLSDAIELIMENPTEAIDSVKELVNYVNTHGTTVEGLQKDIATNKENISKNAENITALGKEISGVETALDGRLDIIEAKPAMDITPDNISKWTNEIGAKAAASAAQQKADSAYSLAEGKASQAALTEEITRATKTEEALDSAKVDKVDGKQLSTEDFTTDLLNKLNGIEEGANKLHITVTSKSVTDGTNTFELPSDVVQDDKYVHTDNNFTDSFKTTIENLGTNYASKTHSHSKAEITDFPTKISEFENDSKYVDEDDLKALNGDMILINSSDGAISIYEALEGLDGVTSKAITTDSKFDAANRIVLTGADRKVSDSAKTISTTITDNNNEVPTSGAVVDYVGSEIAKAKLEGEDVDLSQYYTKGEVDGIAQSIRTEINTLSTNTTLSLADKADKKDLEGLATTTNVQSQISTALTNYYTQDEVDELVDTTDLWAEVNNKANSKDVYTKTEVDGQIQSVQTEVNTLSQNTTLALAGKANNSDLDNYYTQSVLDVKLQELSLGISNLDTKKQDKLTIDTSLNSTSDNPIANKAVNAALDNKVNKDGNKVLSDNNYSDADKEKVDGFQAQIDGKQDKLTIDTFIKNSTNPVQNSAIHSALNDLENKIPSNVSQLTNDSNYATTDYVTEVLKAATGGTDASSVAADLKSHKEASNPHSITPALIGAASTNDLKNYVKLESPADPQTIVSDINVVGSLVVEESVVTRVVQITDGNTRATLSHDASGNLTVNTKPVALKEDLDDYQTKSIDNINIHDEDYDTVETALNALNALADEAYQLAEGLDSSMSNYVTTNYLNDTFAPTKQDKLEAGDNITIEGNKISATIDISNLEVTVDTTLNTNSDNPIANKAVANAIETINNNLENNYLTKGDIILRLDSIATNLLEVFVDPNKTTSYRTLTTEEITFFTNLKNSVNAGEKISGFYTTYPALGMTAYLMLNLINGSELDFSVVNPNAETNIRTYGVNVKLDSNVIVFRESTFDQETINKSIDDLKAEVSETYATKESLDSYLTSTEISDTYATKEELKTKQDLLTAGENITILADGTISANISAEDISGDELTVGVVNTNIITSDSDRLIIQDPRGNMIYSFGEEGLVAAKVTTKELYVEDGLSIPDDKVILSADLKTYYNVGKINNASGINPVTIGTKDQTLRDVFNNLFNMNEEQPTITKEPSITLSLSSDADDEYGTPIDSLNYYITTDDGSYTNESTTGVSFTKYKFTTSYSNAIKDTTTEFTSKKGTVKLSSTYTVGMSSELTVELEGSHTEGTIAKTNLGNNSNPVVQIAEGVKTDIASFSKTATYFTYYAVTDTTDTPGSWNPVGSTSTSDIPISANAGQYIWIASSNSGYTGICELNELSGKYNSASSTEKYTKQTLKNAQDATCTEKYTFYRLTSPRSGTGTATFKLG